jgi:hypothetical protein
MSYVPSHKVGSFPIANPTALSVIRHTASTNQTITVGNRVLIGTVHNWLNSFTPTISSNQFTLPSGYYYYLETQVECYITGSTSSTMDLSYQHYDETNTANIGTLATNFGIYGYSQDLELFSRDACAKALIDCTTASRDISVKIISNDGYDRINYNSTQYIYAGMGRTVIFQLEDAP